MTGWVLCFKRELQMTRNNISQRFGKILLALYVITALILGGAMRSVADDISFRCQVTNEYELTDDGQLVKPERYFYTGALFSVERSTGRIIGGVFENKGDYQMKVIDGYSFKVFSFAEKRRVAESLAIRPIQGGKEYSFVGIDHLQTVVTGTCD
jgi:hypothetical protein